MRRYLLLLVSLLFVMLTIFPHHHHVGGNICITTRVCHKDGRINDEHTKKCHDFHVDRHHLFVTQFQKLKLCPLSDSWDNGLSVFLCNDFWNRKPSELIGISSLILKRIVVCRFSSMCGRLCKHRGPPFME